MEFFWKLVSYRGATKGIEYIRAGAFWKLVCLVILMWALVYVVRGLIRWLNKKYPKKMNEMDIILKRIKRGKYEEGTQRVPQNVTMELLNRKCDICRAKEWTFDFRSDSDDAFDYLCRLGCGESYILVCDECFDAHFNQHPNISWIDVSLEYFEY
jgi:hypothetical protein